MKGKSPEWEVTLTAEKPCLPDEVSLILLRNLSPSSLCQLGATCRYWYRIAHDDFLWQQAFKRSYPHGVSPTSRIPDCLEPFMLDRDLAPVHAQLDTQHPSWRTLYFSRRATWAALHRYLDTFVDNTASGSALQDVWLKMKEAAVVGNVDDQSQFLGSFDSSRISGVLGTILGHDKALCRAFFAREDYFGQELHVVLRDTLSHNQTTSGRGVRVILYCMSERYYETNPTFFTTPTSVYLLVWSTMMLNTDRYSPVIKQKMSLAGFTRMVKGHNSGGDFPLDTIHKLFYSVVSSPLCMGSERPASSPPRTSAARYLLPAFPARVFKKISVSVSSLISSL